MTSAVDRALKANYRSISLMPIPSAHVKKTDAVSDDNDFDPVFLTEAWLKEEGDEPKCKQPTPTGYSMQSLPHTQEAAE